MLNAAKIIDNSSQELKCCGGNCVVISRCAGCGDVLYFNTIPELKTHECLVCWPESMSTAESTNTAKSCKVINNGVDPFNCTLMINITDIKLNQISVQCKVANKNTSVSGNITTFTIPGKEFVQFGL